jgi:uncharacterized protein YjbI with pentapeptide repeats
MKYIIKNILGEVIFKGDSLVGVDLRLANMEGMDLTGVDLSGSILAYAHLSGSVLDGACFNDASLQGLNITNSSLKNIDFSQAKTIKHASFINSDLNGSSFKYEHLNDIDLSGCLLKTTYFIED